MIVYNRSYLRVLSGDVEDVLGQDESDASEDEEDQNSDLEEKRGFAIPCFEQYLVLSIMSILNT